LRVQTVPGRLDCPLGGDSCVVGWDLDSIVTMRLSGLYYSIHVISRCRRRQRFPVLQGVEVACPQPLVQVHAPRSLPDDGIHYPSRAYDAPSKVLVCSMLREHVQQNPSDRELFLAIAWVVHASCFL